MKAICAFVFATLTVSLASAQSVTRCGGPNTALNINWPTFQFDVCRTGYNPYETQLNTGNVNRLALAWQSTIGRVYGFALANNVLYAGSQNGNLYALNAVTGTLIWSYATGGPISGTPAVANGVVYIGSYDKNIYALNAYTGTLLWKYTTQGHVTGAPAVANGAVYLGSGDGYMYALNASDGAPLWQYSTTVDVSTATVVNGIVYFAAGGSIHAVNAGTGKLVWAYHNARSTAAPTVTNGVVYSAAGYLYAIDALTGILLWSRQDLPVGMVACAVANGVLYVGASNRTYLPSVYAFNGKDGTLLWQSHDDYQYSFDLIVANGVLYFASSDPNGTPLVTALDSSNGYIVGQLRPFDGQGGLLVANGFLYSTWADSQDQAGVKAYHLPN